MTTTIKNNKNIKTATAWYLTPDNDKIKNISLPKVQKSYDAVRPFLHCEYVEHLGFTHRGKKYGILMDEEGMLKPNQRDNNCARKLLSKIPIRWGTFTNYYIVYSYDTNEDGDSILRDMDITPKQLVEQWTAAITRRSDIFISYLNDY
jgi:hypothetical protein